MAAGIGHDERVTDDSDLLLTAVDQVPFILVVCEGPELRVLALSAATRAVLPGRAWAGLPIREVISDLIGQRFVDAYYEVYRTGEPVEGAEWRVHLARPDGSVHEMFASFTITPWHDAAGNRRGVIGIGFDVTEAGRLRKGGGEGAGAPPPERRGGGTPRLSPPRGGGGWGVGPGRSCPARRSRRATCSP